MGVNVGVMDVGQGVNVGEGVIVAVNVSVGTKVEVSVVVCVAGTPPLELQAESTIKPIRLIRTTCLICNLL